MDSDGDGLTDREEDADADGMVGPTESDPEVVDTDEDGVDDGADLAPAHIEIPEPMIFDLVRGLGARAGEAEVNALVMSGAPEHPELLRYAPEVEIALGDGFGVEVELPLEGTHLHAVKAAVQGRLSSSDDGRWMQGVQAIGEYVIGDGTGDAHLLWLVSGLPVQGVAIVGMIGGRATITPNGVEGRAIVNGAGYVATSRESWLGAEINASWDPHHEHGMIRATGQVHVSVSPAFRVQLGLGVEHDAQGTAPVGGARVIAEL